MENIKNNDFILSIFGYKSSENREPLSILLKGLIKSDVPFNYRLKPNGSFDILILDDPCGQGNGILYSRYPKRELCKGINIRKEIPSLEGLEAVVSIQNEIIAQLSDIIKKTFLQNI